MKGKKSKIVIVARESGYTDARKEVGMFGGRSTLAAVMRWVENLPFKPVSTEIRLEEAR